MQIEFTTKECLNGNFPCFLRKRLSLIMNLIIATSNLLVPANFFGSGCNPFSCSLYPFVKRERQENGKRLDEQSLLSDQTDLADLITESIRLQSVPI